MAYYMYFTMYISIPMIQDINAIIYLHLFIILITHWQFMNIKFKKTTPWGYFSVSGSWSYHQLVVLTAVLH